MYRFARSAGIEFGVDVEGEDCGLVVGDGGDAGYAIIFFGVEGGYGEVFVEELGVA